jgi:magnesium transporter
VARTRLYRDGVVEVEDFPAEEFAKRLRDEGGTIWLDLVSPTEADLAQFATELGLHELAIEDALQPHQRPKVDVYDTHCFLTAYAVKLSPRSHKLGKAEIDVFITDRAVITVHDADFPIDDIVRRWDTMRHLATNGAGFLVHGIVDYVVDTQYDAVLALDDFVEKLEEQVFEEHPNSPAIQKKILSARRSLGMLRRVNQPMREVMHTLIRREPHLGGTAMTPYFQDVYDHVLQATESTESLREFVATIRDTQVNLQSNRLNLIMKKVTSWAAIIAVPTAISGFYGQNLPLPGMEHTWGAWLSSVAIVVAGVGLYTMFKRRDWL